MAGKSFPRFERGLRLELNDMIHAAETSVLETIGQLIDEFIIGYDYSGNMGRNYIVRGFTVSNTSGTLLAINNGVALCQYRHRGAIKSAVHLSGGDPQKVIDVGGLSNGTYYVYVRFDLLENQFQNRLALDPLASPAPAERVRNVPTRRTESWSVTFADGSPGDEWTQVASFGMSGGAITGVTDTRTLYFEGAPSGGAYPLVPTTDWGTTDDRNNSRGTYGVQGLRKFVRAVQQQLETLQGDGKKWWQTPTKALTDKLNRDGTNTITGSIEPSADNTFSFGAAAKSFVTVWTQTLEALNEVNTPAVNATHGEFTTVDVNGELEADYVKLPTGITPVIGTHENALIAECIPKAVGKIRVTAVGTPPTFSAAVWGCSVQAIHISYNNATRYGFRVALDVPIAGSVNNMVVMCNYGARGSTLGDSSAFTVEWEESTTSTFNLVRLDGGVHVGWDADTEGDWNDDAICFAVYGPQ